MSSSEPEKKAKKLDGAVAQLILSAVCIVLGALLLFVPQVQKTTLSIAFCIAVLVAGVVLITAYFAAKGYERPKDYRFAAGIAMLVIGIVGFIRLDALSERIVFVIGAVTLVLAMIMLQSVVQMLSLKSVLWIPELVFTVLAVAAAVLILADVRALLDKVADFPYWVLVCAGALSLISMLLVRIGLKQAAKPKPEPLPEPANDPSFPQE